MNTVALGLNGNMVEVPEKHNKKKFRLPLMRNRNKKNTQLQTGAIRCCGADKHGCCNVIEEENSKKEFSDKSVQCDDGDIMKFMESDRLSYQIDHKTDSINHNQEANSTRHQTAPETCDYDTNVTIFRNQSSNDTNERLFRKNKIPHQDGSVENVNNKIRIKVEYDGVDHNANAPPLNYVPNDENFYRDKKKKSVEKKGVIEDYSCHERAVDVPDEFEREAYLVLGINSQRKSPFKRKICTPARKPRALSDNYQDHWMTLHSENYNNHPKNYFPHSETPKKNMEYFQKNNNYQKAYSDNLLSYMNSPISSSIDANSILYRSNADNLHRIRNSFPEKVHDKSFKLNVFNASSNETNLKLNNLTRNNEKIKLDNPTFYHRFSGSIQNLFYSSRSDKRGQSLQNFSKSENNLNVLTKSKYTDNFSFGNKLKIDPEIDMPKNDTGWRKYFTINLKMGKRKLENSRRLQDVDGSFFEKFGSLLRQKSIAQEDNVVAPLVPFPEGEEEGTGEGEDLKMAPRMQSIEEGENDSGTETLLDADSDTEDQQLKQNDFIEDAFGWNIEELYEEILFEVIHNIGCEDEDLTEEVLFSYVQDAFKISDEKHCASLEGARNKEAPEIRLNVEVIEAKDLESKDANGLSDPFVTMFIASNPTHRYNTSVKSETLSPVWEEHFSLPISENANEEHLVIEVWDFDPAETVKEKMNKIFDVKGVKGLRKLMKEIAVTASTGKHDNELIGRASIALKSIPATGMVMWYSLDKKNKQKRQGTIRVRLNFSAEKNKSVAAQEHRHLLRILLLHELETSKVAHYWWSGKFTSQGEAVLAQHSAQSGLTPADMSLVQWSVYTTIHSDHPLSFGLFDALLDKIIRPIQANAVSNEELKLFWEATKKLLPSCFAIIRKLRKKTAGDKNIVKTLTEVLNIISKVAMLEPPEGTDLFPAQVYGWIRRTAETEANWDIRETLSDAVNSGADDWFNSISEGHCIDRGTEEEKLQNLIKIIQLVRSDIQKSIEYYDKIFQTTMRFHYTKELYITYEVKLAEIIKSIVDEICRSLKRLELPDDQTTKLVDYEDINMGTTLFELYLVLKRFSMLGSALSPGENNFAIDEYHRWFTPGVTHWLDISVYKALVRIQKAIELDQLIPVDQTVKYSSSAVDTLAIFYQIKIFWQQLAWPDIEGSYMFVGKIVDDICRCGVFYADQMSIRVEGLGDIENAFEKKFEVTQEWCLAINNIDYIRQSLLPFSKELGVDDIISKLSDYKSPMEAQRCAETLKNVIENAVDTEKNKILELVETVARKMSPAMRRFLTEGAELLHQDSNSMDRLMMYLEESLKMLNTELNEVNFERVLDSIWTELSNILYDLVQSNLDKRRPPAFFANLRDTLHIMTENFKSTQNRNSANASDKETLEHIERLLQLHGYETTDLIHQYYKDRLKEQNDLQDAPHGMLTVQCFFKENILELEIMNARNLTPMDSNGSCDSFVRLHFIPEERFPGVVKPRTQTMNKTLFPLYDEKFNITFNTEQRTLKDAIILFSVKDKDLFGMSNQYLAECYLSFNDIADISSDSGKIEQVHLKLSRPHRLDTDCIRALEYRQGDKQAKDFLKKLRQKMGQ